jgi:hypothetical protein
VLFDFFPSRTLTWYLGKTFAVRILAVLVMLVLVLMMLDLLSKSADILAVPGNGEAQLVHYISLRIPQLIARFLPYSVLLATIITLATFNQNSEVVAMKAAGLSAHQILAPLVLGRLAGGGLLVRLQRTRGDPRERDARCVGSGRLRPGPGRFECARQRLPQRRQRRAAGVADRGHRPGDGDARGDVLRAQRRGDDRAPASRAGRALRRSRLATRECAAVRRRSRPGAQSRRARRGRAWHHARPDRAQAGRSRQRGNRAARALDRSARRRRAAYRRAQGQVVAQDRRALVLRC